MQAKQVDHFKPHLNEMLRTFGLDISYERGEGDHLYYRDQSGREIAVLDLVGLMLVLIAIAFHAGRLWLDQRSRTG